MPGEQSLTRSLAGTEGLAGRTLQWHRKISCKPCMATRRTGMDQCFQGLSRAHKGPDRRNVGCRRVVREPRTGRCYRQFGQGRGFLSCCSLCPGRGLGRRAAGRVTAKEDTPGARHSGVDVPFVPRSAGGRGEAARGVPWPGQGRAGEGTCRSRALGQMQLPLLLTPPDPQRDTEG